MSLESHRDERKRREEEELEKARERDARPYDPGRMKGRMPIACGIFFILGILFVIGIMIEIIRKIFWS